MKTPTIFALLTVFFLFLGFEKGPDADNYIDWASAVSKSDFHSLDSQTLSPLGIPLSQHAPGTGLIISSFDLVLSHLFDLGSTIKIATLTICVLFWWIYTLILQKVSQNSVPLTVFGLSATYLGTHIGHYSTLLCSESFTLPFLVLMIWLALNADSWEKSDFFFLGILAAITITISSMLIFYATFILLFGLIHYMRRHNSSSITGIKLILILCPLAIGISIIFLVNYWMTGSLLHSPYIFGNENFKSTQFLNPEFGAVLFHPLRGIAVYHPLYLLAFLYLSFEIFFLKNNWERFVFIGVAVICFYQLLIVVSWYGWWLGMGNVNWGIRAMTSTGVILVSADVYLLQRRKVQSPAFFKIIIWITCVSCIWTYLTFFTIGKEFYSYQGLFLQIKKIAFPFWKFLLIFFLIALVIGLIFRTTGPAKKQILSCDLLQAPTIFLIILISHKFIYQLALFINGKMDIRYSILPGTIWLGVFLIFLSQISKTNAPTSYYPRFGIRKICGGIAVMFLISTLLFLKMVWIAEDKISGIQQASPKYKWKKSFKMEEVLGTYKEYLQIPGFIDKKRKLYIFLKSQDSGQENIPPPP